MDKRTDNAKPRVALRLKMFMVLILMISFSIIHIKIGISQKCFDFQRVVTAHFRNLRSKRIMWVMILVMKLSKISKSLNAKKVENEFIFTPFFKPKNQAQFI